MKTKNAPALLTPTGCGKKVPPKIFCSFLGSRLEFQNKILPTYLANIYTNESLITIKLAFGVFKLSTLQ